jgi:DNA processing protein
MSDDLQAERLARAALCRLAEPGSTRMSGLVAQLGAETVYAHLLEEQEMDGVYTDVTARLRAIEPRRDLEAAQRLGIRFVIPGDVEWPAQLDDLAHCDALQDRGGSPLGLWIKGPLRLHDHADSIGIVGSRSSTTYGNDVAASLAAGLGKTGVAVISGAAFGIDQAAHRGALAGRGPTIAVLACGVDRAYPVAHKQLLDHLGDHGAVVSELAPGCAPTRARFLARNRLIAAFTRGTIVVEAAARSGALNTANWADRLSRRLMAVPGPVTSAASAGVHQLIRGGSATLVTGVDDVLEQLSPSGAHVLPELREPERSRDRLSTGDAQVLDAVPVVRPVLADSLARTAGVGLVQVQSALERLARDGFVEQVSGGWRLGPAAR